MLNTHMFVTGVRFFEESEFRISSVKTPEPADKPNTLYCFLQTEIAGGEQPARVGISVSKYIPYELVMRALELSFKVVKGLGSRASR